MLNIYTRKAREGRQNAKHLHKAGMRGKAEFLTVTQGRQEREGRMLNIYTRKAREGKQIVKHLHKEGKRGKAEC